MHNDKEEHFMLGQKKRLLGEIWNMGGLQNTTHKTVRDLFQGFVNAAR